MKSELRLDRITAGKLKRFDNGFIRFPITATRAGIFVYRDTKGAEWRELRPPEEVFHADSMASLAAIPITNDHPEELLNHENTSQHQVGWTSDQVLRADVFIKTSATITQKAAIDEMMKGKQEISAGYTCEIDPRPGVWNGQRYDAVQRNIRYNHVAIVSEGRAGKEVRVHFDDAAHTEKVMRLDSFIDIEAPKNTGDKMKTIVIDGNEYQISPEAHAAITGKFTRDSAAIVEAKARADAEKAEATKLTARADSLADEVENLKKQTPKLDDAQLKEAVKNRVALERFASTRIDADDLADKTDREIIEALIKLDNKDFKADGKDDVYLQARLDHMIETASKIPPTRNDGKGGAHSQARKIASEREDGKGSPALSYEEARLAKMQRDSERYTKPIGYGVK